MDVIESCHCNQVMIVQRIDYIRMIVQVVCNYNQVMIGHAVSCHYNQVVSESVSRTCIITSTAQRLLDNCFKSPLSGMNT